jgi:hypothetical protein
MSDSCRRLVLWRAAVRPAGEVEEIAGLDDGFLGLDGEEAARSGRDAAAALEAEVGLEPGGDVVASHGVVEPAADVADGGLAGGDDFV